jgi:hypothetical protein
MDAREPGTLHCLNLLIYGMEGGRGGDAGSGPLGNAGGRGGDAWGIEAHAPQPFLQNLTISGMTGGRGGEGAPLEQALLPAHTALPTTKRFAGPGGDGGNAAGLALVANTLGYVRHNIVVRSLGGAAGGGGGGEAGIGHGVKASGSVLLLSYHDLWANEVDFSGCLPGWGLLRMDPLFAGCCGLPPYFLSQVAAGEEADSPCVDAGEEPAAAIFGEDRYTTRTDREPDRGILDLGYHFDEGEDPTVTPRPTWTPEGSPSPTPTPEATPSPEPTATPSCSELGVELLLPASHFRPGDLFQLQARICNPEEITYWRIPFFVVLDLFGELYFAPSWGSALDHYTITLFPGPLTMQVIPTFVWPAGVPDAEGVYFHGALTDAEMTTILGSPASESFGWSAE